MNDYRDEYLPRTDEELMQLAKDITNDKVFSTFDCPDCGKEKLCEIFKAFKFLGKNDFDWFYQNDIVFFYQYREEADADITEEGWPTFTGFKFLDRDDGYRLKNFLSILKFKGLPDLIH